jgi:addiction module RelE/StbE family toxin
MLSVRWLPKASEKLATILEYISARNYSAAADLLHQIERAVEQLPQHPYLYRTGREAGTREIVVHPNYIVVYRVQRNEIQIVTVVHSRERYP